MSKIKFIMTVMLLMLAVGCSSGVTRPDNQSAEQQTYILSSTNQVKNLSISLSSKAQAKSADNLKFNSAELKDTVQRALTGRELLSSDDDSLLPSVEILVTDMRVRSNFTAVALGFLAGSDSIKGDVIVKNEEGEVLNKFSVSTSYALGGFAGGQDSSRMGWLYEEFAKQTVNELQGIKPEPAQTN